MDLKIGCLLPILFDINNFKFLLKQEKKLVEFSLFKKSRISPISLSKMARFGPKKKDTGKDLEFRLSWEFRSSAWLCIFVIFKNNLNGFWEFLPWY
jgi:hypothetical protein